MICWSGLFSVGSLTQVLIPKYEWALALDPKFWGTVELEAETVPYLVRSDCISPGEFG